MAPCAPGEADVAPCRTRFDTAAALLREAPASIHPGEARTPRVWMYVDETGVVRQAQIGYSAGMDWDRAAIERAKQYLFQPAMLDGQPTSAWVYLPVVSIPEPQTCADFEMAVPISAGVAQFVDSLVFESASQGRGYKYVVLASDWCFSGSCTT